MDWSQQFFIYCERGLDPSFWAEPFNALSNAAFLIAAGVAFAQFRAMRRPDAAVLALIVIVAIIGAGSFLFHTYATRWAVIFDIAPIGVFMIAYLTFALRRFLAASWWIVAAALAAFALLVRAAGLAPCNTGLLPLTEAAGRACLNGSLAYAPALVALPILAGLLIGLKHCAASLVTFAAITLAASLTLRTLDIELCALTEALGRVRGTHALWHVLNGVVLYLLLAAAMRSNRSPLALPSTR